MATRRLLPLTAPGANLLTQVEGTLRGGQYGGRLFEFDTGEDQNLFEYQPGGFGIGSFRQLQKGFTDEELKEKYGDQDIFQLPVSGRELGTRSTIQTVAENQIARPGFTARAFQSPSESGFQEGMFREGEAPPEGTRFLSPEQVSRFEREASLRGQQLAGGQQVQAALTPQASERPNLVIRAGDRGNQLFGVFGGVGRDRVLRPIDQSYGIEPLFVKNLDELKIPEGNAGPQGQYSQVLGGIRDIPPRPQGAPSLSQGGQMIQMPSSGPSLQPGAPSNAQDVFRQGGSLGEGLYAQTLAELKQAQAGVQGLYEQRARQLEQRPSAVERLKQFREQQGIPQLQQGILEATKQQGLLEAGAEATPDQVKEATQAFFVSAPKLQALTNLRLGEFAKALNAVNRYINVLNTSLGFQSDAVKEFLNASQLDQAAALEAIDTRIKGGENAQLAAEKVFDILGDISNQQRANRQLQLQEQAGEREQQAFDIEAGRQRAEDAASALVKVEPSSGKVISPSADAITNAAFRLGVPRDTIQRFVNDRIDALNEQQQKLTEGTTINSDSVDNWAKNILRGAGSIGNVPSEQRTAVNDRINELLATGYSQLTPEQKSELNRISDDLRQEPLYRDMVDVQSAYQAVKVGASFDNGAGDLAMINGYQKMIDPGVSVRQEEFKTVEEAQGWIQRVLNIPGKVLDGARMTPVARDKMEEVADKLFEVKVNNFNATKGQTYKERAAIYDLDPKLLGINFSIKNAASAISSQRQQDVLDDAFSGIDIGKIDVGNF